MANTMTGRAGDFVLHMESEKKCLKSGQLTMPASGGPHTLADVTAYPLKASNVLALATEEASVVAFAVRGPKITALANDANTAVVNGYAIINLWDGVVLNRSVLPANDVAGTGFTIATIVSTLEALGVKFLTEPTKSTEQTN